MVVDISTPFGVRLGLEYMPLDTQFPGVHPVVTFPVLHSCLQNASPYQTALELRIF